MWTDKKENRLTHFCVWERTGLIQRTQKPFFSLAVTEWSSVGRRSLLGWFKHIHPLIAKPCDLFSSLFSFWITSVCKIFLWKQDLNLIPARRQNGGWWAGFGGSAGPWLYSVRVIKLSRKGHQWFDFGTVLSISFVVEECFSLKKC